MATFLNTTGVNHYLDELMKHANETLILISPYLKVNENIKLTLEDKNRMKTMNIRIVYGKNELQPEETIWLKGLDFVHSSFCKNLHAKCYLSEKEAIITSMNLYEFSQVNNQEMGVHISKDADPDLFRAVYEEAQRLIRFSQEVKISVEKVAPTPDARTSHEKPAEKTKAPTDKANAELGHCIHCSKEITLDPSHPFCRDCYGPWKKNGGDKGAEQRYCFICGEKHNSTFDRPAHLECYRKNKKLFDVREAR